MVWKLAGSGWLDAPRMITERKCVVLHDLPLIDGAMIDGCPLYPLRPVQLPFLSEKWSSMVFYSPGLGLSCARAQAFGHEHLTHCESLRANCRFEPEIQARRFLVSPRPQSRLGRRSSRKIFAAPLPPCPVQFPSPSGNQF